MLDAKESVHLLRASMTAKPKVKPGRLHDSCRSTECTTFLDAASQCPSKRVSIPRPTCHGLLYDRCEIFNTFEGFDRST